MELRMGYKQTELGVIPVDWEVLPIDKIFSFYSTSNYSKAQMDFDGDVGCIHYGLIHAIPNSIYDVRKGIKYYVTKEQANYETIKNGDIIMVDASEDLEGVNKSIELFGIEDELFIAGLHTYLLRDSNSILANGFRGAILNSTAIKSQFNRLAVGMKVFGVSKPQLRTVLIPVPTKAEQTAIATALSDMDNLIAGLEKLIEKKKAIKQGAMQELLRPKEGWVVKSLGDLGEIIGGGTPSSFNLQYWNGSINWFTPTEVGFSKYLAESDRKITKTGLESSSARILPKGAVLLTTRAGIGDVGILKNEAATNQGFQSVVVNDKNDNEYIYYLLTTLKSEFLRNASGSTFLEISPGKLKSIEVCLPGKSEQCNISRILCDIDNEIERLKNNLRKYKLLKQGMMQELLTGKTRLV